jgi:epoxyqueuosine reductase
MTEVGELAAWVEGIIKEFVESPENTLMNAANERAWAEPLVGFSSGADPLYRFYKGDIGHFYLTPIEWFEKTFPGVEASLEELTVISWILPQTEATKAENRRQRAYPSERWARSRIFGEKANVKLRGHIAEALIEAGYPAVAPMNAPLWARGTSKRYGYASNWSERHAAYAAGLGTFGLCDGLITPLGKAMRAGSVIARIQIPPSARPYEDHHSYCLLYMRGTCGECIPRCPVGAISEEGHNKARCSDHLNATRKYVESIYGFKGYGCGLCQTGVPCESRIPPELVIR